MDYSERMSIFLELHQGNTQEGLGNSMATGRAFSMLDNLPAKPSILDAGCGPGRQTIDLCRLTSGHVTAVDLHQPDLEYLMHRALEKD